MRITRDKLKEYNEGDIVMTRSFLSTSEMKEVAMHFLGAPNNHDEVQSIKDNERQLGDGEEKQSVMCIYKVIYPRSSLDITELSVFDQEKEVLIAPFAVFQIMKIEDVCMDIGGKNYPIKVIHLKECDSTLV